MDAKNPHACRYTLVATWAVSRVPPIRYPEYMPSGEMRLVDPDGYSVVVAHWGNKEQEIWEKRIKAQPPRG